MTIKEVEELRKAEKQGNLRKPNNMLFTNNDEQLELFKLMWLVSYLIKKNVTQYTREKITEDDTTLAEDILNNSPLIESLDGVGKKDNPYILKTTFAEGEFFDATAIIKPDKLGLIKKHFCFSNAFQFAMAIYSAGLETEQLSGIAYGNKAFLHSVIAFVKKGKKFILDLNYDLIMDYDLYIKLFSFEILAVNNGKAISADVNQIIKASKGSGFTSNDWHLAFAYDEVMLKLKRAAGITDGL